VVAESFKAAVLKTAARGAHGALLSYGSLPVPVIEWLMLDDDRGLQAVAR